MPSQAEELAILLKAYDEFSSSFAKFQRTVKEVAGAEKDLKKQTDDTNKAHQGLLETLGQLGVLYAFQRGLRQIAQVGGDLEAQLYRVSAVTGEALEGFQKFTLGSTGSQFGPQEQAKALLELGAAGLSGADSLKALPEAAAYAQAGLTSLDNAITSGLVILKAYKKGVEELPSVYDAFALASNKSALQAEDLTLALAQSAATAKLAGLSFQELIAALSVVRDAGLSASDGGTSIKAALLALLNPSAEAQKIMKALGIELYDSAGNMKDLAGIIGEFEKGLSGLDQQSRQYALTTIAGTDGVRALTLMIDRGSGFIRTMTDELGQAEGTTRSLAAQMNQSFSASVQRASGNVERLSAVIFGDLEPVMKNVVDTTNDLAVGFATLSPEIRGLIELLLGAGGLAVAFKTTLAAWRGLAAALGLSAAAAGPIGAAIVGVLTLVGALVALHGEQAQAAQRTADQAKTVLDLAASYDEVTRTGQGSQDVLQEIARVMPDVVTQWDEHGNAVAIDTERLRENTEAARENMRVSQQAMVAQKQREIQALRDQQEQIRRSRTTESLTGYTTEGQAEAAATLNEADRARFGAARMADLDRQIATAEAELSRLNAQLNSPGFTGAQPFGSRADRPEVGGVGVTLGGRHLDPSMFTGGAGKGSASDPVREYADLLRRVREIQQGENQRTLDGMLNQAKTYFGRLLDEAQKESAKEASLRQQIARIQAAMQAQEVAERRADFERTLAEIDQEITRVKSDRVVNIVAGQRVVSWDVDQAAQLEKQRADEVRQWQREEDRRRQEEQNARLESMRQMAETARAAEIENIKRNMEVVEKFFADRQDQAQAAWSVLLDTDRINREATLAAEQSWFNARLAQWRDYINQVQALQLKLGAAAAGTGIVTGTNPFAQNGLGSK